MNNSKLFGKYAFANERLPNYKVEPEKNTKIEDEVEKALKGHFKANQQLSDKVVSAIKSALETDDYSDIIFEPDADIVYRGMYVDSTWLANQIEQSTWKIPKQGNIKKTFFFKPFKNRSSWSLDKEKAKQFANSSFFDRIQEPDEGKSYIIILKARISDNPNKFISGPDGLYKLKFTLEYQDELECIGFGDISVTELSWQEII